MLDSLGKHVLLFGTILSCIVPASLEAQQDAQIIRVIGKVLDEREQPISNTIIVNRRTKTGGFGKPDGTFSVECLKSDSLTVTSLGYFTRTVCFDDSTVKDVYRITTYLEQRTYRLAQVEVFAARDLEKIQEDIKKLGYREEDYMLSGINAAMSPITFLYQQFSRKEQSKRLVAQLENEDMKRELLKELFNHYVDYHIIELSDEDFDAFIDYINVTDEFLIQSSQYDFLIYVKDRFADFRIQKRRKGLGEEDFQYDQD